MVTTITDVLNAWNQMGVFSYVIPFLLLFALVFAILEKSKVLGDNRTIEAIVAVAVGLLALQFDFVSRFFAIIFPRFGIGLSIFLVLIITIGFFFPKNDSSGTGRWIGWAVGIGVVLWALSSWNQLNNYVGSGVGGWLSENIWAIIVLVILVAIVFIIGKSGGDGLPKGD